MAETPHFADVEIRIRAKQDIGYPVELTVQTPTNDQEFEGGHLTDTLLPWVPTDSAEQDGERLFDWLLHHDSVKKAWAQIRGQSPNRRVRLRIDAAAPELHAIPWELLRDSSPSSPSQTLAADSHVPFSRYLAGQWESGPPIEQRPLKMLVAIADPENLADYQLNRLDVADETEIIRQATASFSAHELQLDFLEPPITLTAIETALKQGYHLLHVVAHGLYNKRRDEAAILLATVEHDVERVRDAEFAEMLARQRQKPQLIFLATCQSATRSPSAAFRGLAPQLVGAGIPVVLAMQDIVPVETARAFTEVFYRQLFQHGLVDLASNEARSRLLTGKLAGSVIPVLFSRLMDNQLLVPVERIERKPYEPETVHVPAGEFIMGDGAEAHAVHLDDFYIGKYPVTNGQYAMFIKQTKHSISKESGWSSLAKTPPADKLNHPVTGVSFRDALAYCDWLTQKTGRVYRLPSEAEWEKAARGTEGQLYPWGNEWDASRCHFIIKKVAGKREARLGSRSTRRKPRNNAHETPETAPVEAHASGQSGYGCYDMVGNVKEWTRTLWGTKQLEADFDYPYQADDGREASEEAADNVLRILRGTGYEVRDEASLTCTHRNKYRAGKADKAIGFRVVSS